MLVIAFSLQIEIKRKENGTTVQRHRPRLSVTDAGILKLLNRT